MRGPTFTVIYTSRILADECIKPYAFVNLYFSVACCYCKSFQINELDSSAQNPDKCWTNPGNDEGHVTSAADKDCLTKISQCSFNSHHRNVPFSRLQIRL